MYCTVRQSGCIVPERVNVYPAVRQQSGSVVPERVNMYCAVRWQSGSLVPDRPWLLVRLPIPVN